MNGDHLNDVLMNMTEGGLLIEGTEIETMVVVMNIADGVITIIATNGDQDPGIEGIGMMVDDRGRGIIAGECTLGLHAMY